MMGGLLGWFAGRCSRVGGIAGGWVALLLTSFATSPLPAPAAPSDLVVSSVSKTGLTLTWKDNPPAATAPWDSTTPIGFEIERGADGAPFQRVAVVAAGVTTFSDTGLVPG